MYRNILFFIIFISLLLCIGLKESIACESCAIPRLGHDQGAIHQESKDKKWFFKYLFEQQNWDKMDAREAHNLHHQGHHFHDKTTEDFHHFTLGSHLRENFAVSVEIPYVIRRSLEVDDHAILGSKQRSDGWSDLHLITKYSIWERERKSVGFAGGIKFPTGQTDEQNSAGTRFEPELQPGTGSYDYVIGGIYKQEKEQMGLLANIAYVFKNEGSRDFEFGDLFSTSVFFDYLLNPESKMLQTKIGIDANLQYEQKQKESGIKVNDSGGTTLLLGPSISVGSAKNVSVFGSILFPAYQNLGGVHQELDYTWTAGGKIAW